MDPLIAALLKPAAYDHPVQRVQLLETHISWILLTGSFAYKLRKPVQLGFVGNLNRLAAQLERGGKLSTRQRTHRPFRQQRTRTGNRRAIQLFRQNLRQSWRQPPPRLQRLGLATAGASTVNGQRLCARHHHHGAT